jgi:thiol:disulfide interchange protein/DsbC/DsbD-like thiol-disulfide interchange protein
MAMNNKLFRVTLLIAGLLCLWLAFQPPSPALALDEETPFAVSLAQSEATISQGASSELIVNYQVFKDHFIYRDMSSVAVVDASGLDVGEARFPRGINKFDKISDKQREIYQQGFAVAIPISASVATSPGVKTVRLLAKWQGCNLPKNYCLFPTREELAVTVNVVKPADAPRGGPPEGDSAAKLPPVPGTAPKVSFEGLPSTASYQEVDSEGRNHPVHARMFADVTTASAGSEFRLAVHLEQQKGWHTYWKSPGDIGLPTRIEWTLPEGWKAAPFEFPVPLRFDQEGIVSYGYDDEVLFFSDVQVPQAAQPGEVQLQAKVNWLVCEVSCIPGEATLSLPMTISAAVDPKQDAEPRAALIDHFAAQHPIAATSITDFAIEASLSVSAVQPEQPFKAAIRITPTGDRAISAHQSAGLWPAFVPIVNLNGMLTELSVTTQENGVFTFTIDAESFELEEGADLPQGELIGGLLQLQSGEEWLRTEVILPVSWAKADELVAKSRSGLFVGEQVADGAGTPVVADSGEREAPGEPIEGGRFVWMLLLAFLGGMLLNVMPCVLPVLTMKLYSLVEQKDISASDRRVAGFAYSAGIVFSFVALAIAVVILRLSFGQDVLWGFQFQYPAYVAALAALVWLFGLSLFGVFEVPALGANQAAEASAGEGTAGYFLTGVFATLLATPCSAPFLGTGMGFAFSLPTAGILLFFAVAGLGLAAPFLVISVVPALFRFLPRPGAWMDTFKHLMGFTLIATTLWLVDVLVGQIGGDRGISFLAVLLFLSIGAWVFGRWGGPTESGARQVGAFIVAVAVSGAGALLFLDLEMATDEVPATSAVVTDLDFSESVPWQPFTEERLAALEGTTVFVDFTADWCLTCKVNEKTILETKKVRGAMRDLGVVPLKADWTRRDPVITRWLQRYGKAGVPFYLVIPSDRSLDNIALPEVITSDWVIAALKQSRG